MTNPATPSPAPKGGMPKWLIIVLVVLVVVVLVCCGGVTTCFLAARRVAKTGVQAATQKIHDEMIVATQRAQDEMMAATQRAADEATRQAAQNIGGAGAANAGAGGNGASGSGGSTGGGRPAVNFGGSLPSNFPKDVPVMAGFTSSGVSVSDSVQGTGMVMLGGKGARADVVAYYEKQMKDQGWAEAKNVEIGESSTMIFTKDTRQATIQAITSDGNTMLTIRYEPKP